MARHTHRPDRSPDQVRLYGWRHPAVLSAAALSVFAGFAQFASTAALPDVAAAFGGAPRSSGSLAAQVGLSGTTLGLGLAIIRLASLGALPLAGIADRRGRRSVMLACTAAGLAMTAVAAGSPGFWSFVVLFALGRPLLSATNAVAGVVAAEETRSTDRAKAIALITAGYGFGAGVPVVLRAVAPGMGFRVLFLLAAVPLLLVPLVGRSLQEPDRHRRLRASGSASLRLGRVRPELRGRLALLCALTFAIAFVTGPVNTYLFVYAENVAGLTSTALGVLVPAAGVIGLAGLLGGRWAADRLGRRVTAIITHVGIAAAGVVTYTLGAVGVVVGYLASILIASAYAPAAGALSYEIFPTSVRATSAGWLTASGTLGASTGLLCFGLLADGLGGFGQAALLIAAPVAVSAAGYARLPETRGLELEESAPDAPPATPESART